MQSGLLDGLLNCRSGNPHAVNDEVLELNLLSAQRPEELIAELTSFSSQWNSRLKQVIEYECILTEESLSTRNEPDDKVDFREFEDNLDDRQLPTSLRDVIQPSKRFFMIVGPDLSNLTKLRCVDIQLGTIQTQPTRVKSEREAQQQ